MRNLEPVYWLNGIPGLCASVHRMCQRPNLHQSNQDLLPPPATGGGGGDLARTKKETSTKPSGVHARW